MTWIDGVEVAGEAADDAESMGPPAAGAVGWLHGPCHRHVDRDEHSTQAVHVGEELVEELLGPGQLEAERPADGQILLEGLLELVHACAPGQGCATVRRASRSTLAYMAVVSRLRWRRTWPTSVRLAPARSIWVA